MLAQQRRLKTLGAVRPTPNPQLLLSSACGRTGEADCPGINTRSYRFYRRPPAVARRLHRDAVRARRAAERWSL